MTATGAAALELDGVVGAYGQTVVVRDVDLVVSVGSVVALLGPNGAGKTTLLRLASGLLIPRSGRVLLDGVDATKWAAHRVARAGLCLIPEGRGIYPSLTVAENLQLHTPRSPHRVAAGVVEDVFPVLGRRRMQVAGTLSGGEQQMLALARAYLANPRVVLVDELSMGLAPILVKELFQSLRRLAEHGVALLIVEQFVNQALDLADQAYVLSNGVITYSGPAQSLDRNRLMSDYLSQPSLGV